MGTPRWAGAKEALQQLWDKSVRLVRPVWFSTFVRGGDGDKPAKGYKIGVLIGCDEHTVVVVSSRKDLERLKSTIEIALLSMDRQAENLKGTQEV